MVEYRPAAVSGQVEVGMVRQVDRRFLVGFRHILDRQLALVGERIRYGNSQVAGIALFSVRTGVRELNPLPFVR
jgi:hypothetical protein